MKNKDPKEQKFENEVKKLKIQAEFGARLFENPEVGPDPEVESKWLDSIIAFEKAAAKKEVKKIREVLSYPEFAPPDSLDENKIPKAMESVMELLKQKGILVDTVYEVPDKELYRFICEDLMEVDMNIIDSPGWMTTFTYEEFHPNHVEDLKRDVSEIVECILKGTPAQIDWKLDDPINYNNRDYIKKEFLELMEGHESRDQSRLIELTMDTPTISLPKGQVTAYLEYSVDNHETKKSKISFEFVNEYDWWMIMKASFPPIDIS